jgi:hypothetical protein
VRIRTAADSLPDRAPRAVRPAVNMLRIPPGPVQLGFSGDKIDRFDHCPDPVRIQARSFGCVSNLWSPSGNTTHGCALRVQKCTVGRSQDVSSSVPAQVRYRSRCRGVDHRASAPSAFSHAVRSLFYKIPHWPRVEIGSADCRWHRRRAASHLPQRAQEAHKPAQHRLRPVVTKIGLSTTTYRR